MGKLNCWEYKKCGREPGGRNVTKLGACPAATDTRLHGVNGGRNAGRACWVVAGSMCGTTMLCPDARKMKNCWRCDFMNVVKAAEERGETGFSATLPEMERTLQTEATMNLFADRVYEGLSTADVQKRVSRERIELVKFMVHKMLGPKSSRFIMKIDELHDRYGERCCDRIEELDEVAQIFYGKLVAKNLREEIARIVQGSME
jgi:hypothetical protein